MKANLQIDRQEFDHINEKLIRLVLSLSRERAGQVDILGVGIFRSVALSVLQMYDKGGDLNNELKGIAYEMDVFWTITLEKIEQASHSYYPIQPNDDTFTTFIEARYYLYALNHKYEKGVSMEEAIAFYHSGKEDELKRYLQDNNNPLT